MSTAPMGQGGHNSSNALKPSRRTPDQFQEDLNPFPGEVDVKTEKTQSVAIQQISTDIQKSASANSKNQNIETVGSLTTRGAITIDGDMRINTLAASNSSKTVSAPFNSTTRYYSERTITVIGWSLGFGLMLIGLQTGNLIITGIGCAVVIASLAHYAD